MDQRDMERRFFLPGETTLARSDEDTHPLDSQEVNAMKRKPYSNFWKEMTGFCTSDWLTQIIEKVYPPIEKVLQKYWKQHGVWIADFDLVQTSGWYGSKDGARKWLQLSASVDSPHLKQLAKELGDVLIKAGYPEVSCMILLDTYSRRTIKNTASQFKEGLQNSVREPLGRKIPQWTLDHARHFSLVSGSAIGPCFDEAKGQIRQGWEGTVAAYLTNGSHTVGISNSHVFGPPGDSEPEEHSELGPHTLQTHFQMPAGPTYDRVHKDLPRVVGRLRAHLGEYRSHDDGDSDEDRRFLIRKDKATLEHATKLRNEIQVGFDSASQRRVGHTLWASDLTSTKGSFAVDVGLLLLDLPPATKPENKMPLVGDYHPDRLLDFMQLHNSTVYPRLLLNEKNCVHFRPDRYASETFIRKPPPVCVSDDQDIALSVMMTGGTSGTMTGILLPDACRRAIRKPNGEICYVRQYVVIGKMDDRRCEFSSDGDSGAMCVTVDMDGQALLLGIVTGGTGLAAITEKTFICPWFVVNDMLEVLVKRGILPVGPNRWSMDMDQLAR